MFDYPEDVKKDWERFLKDKETSQKKVRFNPIYCHHDTSGLKKIPPHKTNPELFEEMADLGTNYSMMTQRQRVRLQEIKETLRVRGEEERKKREGRI